MTDIYIYIYIYKYTHLRFLLMVLFKSGVVPNKLPSYDFECPTIYLLSISFGINFPEPNKHQFYSEVFIYKNFFTKIITVLYLLLSIEIEKFYMNVVSGAIFRSLLKYNSQFENNKLY